MSAARLARLVRLRETQHSIAAASAARAQAAVAGIDGIAARVGGLRAALSTQVGPVRAHDLHGHAELAARLDAATQGLHRSRAEATREHDARERERQIAHRAEDGATRLHDRVSARLAADAERRIDAVSTRIKRRSPAQW